MLLGAFFWSVARCVLFDDCCGSFVLRRLSSVVCGLLSGVLNMVFCCMLCGVFCFGLFESCWYVCLFVVRCVLYVACCLASVV